ncbi:dioxygenase [Brachionus plicatilis]|uniref:Dioxygenase n=1 Tax=Brachionus plicatilis TaxID=10195 RepID=A0A3M7PA15_BRAPC|nr:dioxygenase [Brachionus plicatilis]
MEGHTNSRLPALFLSHGGGPCFFMDINDSVFKEFDRNSDATRWYKQVAQQVKITSPPSSATDQYLWSKPKSILIISAHWETKGSVCVTNQLDHKELLYDYNGFPEFTYKLKYPAKGNPELSKKVVDLLTKKNIKVNLDNKRNFDHGVFVPLLLVYPDCDIPVVEMSVNANLDPKLHLEIGKALSSLRDEGILIIGSGHCTHGKFSSSTNARLFINALVNTLVNKTAEERFETLLNWQKLPFAREAHSREEHLIPLHVVVGAAGTDKGFLLNEHMAGDLALHSFSFTQ